MWFGVLILILVLVLVLVLKDERKIGSSALYVLLSISYVAGRSD